MGVANDRSIAWGIAKKLNEHGAELAFTYVGDALKKRVIPDLVFNRESKTSFLLLPIQDTIPEPVITTLRINSP